MLTEGKVIEIYALADDFCKVFCAEQQRFLLKTTRKYHRDSKLSDAEMITILVLFHLQGYRCLKHFYMEHVCKHMTDLFPNTVSYSRFVTLQRSVLLPLTIFLKEVLPGECTGISFVDSTPLRVCKPQRIHSHKVFRGLAARGHSSVGWFFGFKLHLICNDRGELLNFVFTPANVDDRQPLDCASFMKNVKGKPVGDKGYLSQKLFERLFVDGIQLVTKIKKNMKNSLTPLYDKLLLRKRAIIETINDRLKNICQVEHSRHRSFENFVANLIAAMAAYCFFPKKPSINLQLNTDNQLNIC